MNFQQSVDYLLSLGNEVLAMKLGLDSTQKLLKALGNPHLAYAKVQVAGTNGKGSVCAFLDSICRAAQIRTGLYTSPHLISITERIKIDGQEISEDEFASIASLIRETSEALVEQGALESVPTFFEQVTSIALKAFEENNVELAILETGLGGRLDATTAAKAEIVAVTRIDYDHQKILGTTLTQIAAEKAAVIRPGTVVCVGRQPTEAFEVIMKRCAEAGVVPKTLLSARWKQNPAGVDLGVEEFYGREILLSLKGEFQYENAALAALLAAQLKPFFSISNKAIISGLEQAEHPGRLEWVEKGGTRILLDGAHNRGGADALAHYLKHHQAGALIALVYASMRDKNIESFFEVLSPLVDHVFLTEAGNTRSFPASEMSKILRPLLGEDKMSIVPDAADALDSALKLAGTYTASRPAFVVVTGSLYLVGEVKKILNN